MPARRKNNDNRQSRQEILREYHIPQDNVIDLKKIYEERKDEQSQKEAPIFDKVTSKVSKYINRPKKEKTRHPFSLQIQWPSLITFSLLCCLIVIPILLLISYQRIDLVKGRVLGASVSALENLKLAGTAMTDFDLAKAQTNFALAESDFKKAEGELKTINSALLTLIKLVPFKGATLSSGEHLIYAGRQVAEIGKIISEKVEPINSTSNGLSDKSLVLPEIIFSLGESLDTIAVKIKATQEHLEKVKPSSLPEEYQPEIEKIKEILPSLDDYTAYLSRVFKAILTLLGSEQTKEYLFIFQNSQELRPTGGFIGSLALINLEKGQVKILEVPGRGPYEINDDFEKMIIPPKPLWLINNQWQIQDANWFPDFPSSAKKINWFYEQARGFKVDGIISFTPDIITELLKITGPITMDKYETVLTSQNFIEQTQREVELEYEKEVNKPKQIIADLMPILLNKIMQSKPEDFFEVIRVFNEAIIKKDLLIYTEDSSLEEELRALGFAGEIKNSQSDYLMVVNTNVGGGKTDGVIDQTIYHQAEIFQDGSIVDTLTIRRSHQGDPDDFFTKIKNMDYLRVYVPEGSELISARGFSNIDKSLLLTPEPMAQEDQDLLALEKEPFIHERSETRITKEFGKTVFANWLGLEVGESREVILEYKLPFKLAKSDIYSLYIQKQPGAKESEIKTELYLPSDFQIVEQTPEGLLTEDNVLKYKDTLARDKAYGVILESRSD